MLAWEQSSQTCHIYVLQTKLDKHVMFECVRVFIYTYIHVQVHMNIYTHTCTQKHKHTHTNTHTHTNPQTHTFIRTYTHAKTHTHTQTHHPTPTTLHGALPLQDNHDSFRHSCPFPRCETTVQLLCHRPSSAATTQAPPMRICGFGRDLYIIPWICIHSS